jgi:GNAT superfamily N-acetyltransferase
VSERLLEIPARSVMSDVQIRFVSPRSEDATALLAALTRELAALYADRGDAGDAGFDPSHVEVPGGAFAVAYLEGAAAGCGAIRPYDAESAELKRMYTAQAFRGRGVAAAILAALEVKASEFGFRRMILETGDRQANAERVYERAGYVRIPPYGIYVDWTDSRCYARQLVG